jgi:AcrR family transcriptional regulator
MGLNPEKVVSAAAEMADRDGLEALSLSALAGSLGVRVPSLYKHVGGLDDLLRRVAADSAAGLSATVRAALADRAGGESLLALGAAVRQYATTHPGRFAVIRWAAAHGYGGFEDVEACLAEVLRAYGQKPDAAEQAARTVLASVVGLVSAELSGRLGNPEAAEPSVAWLLTLLERGLADLRRPDRRRGAFRLPALGSLPVLPGLSGLSGLPGLGRA